MAKEVLEMEVKSNIKSVTKETDELGKSLGKASDETKGLGTGLATTGTAGSKGFKMISSAVYGLGVALKAIGIGLVIALFVSLKESLQRNQKVMNAINTIMTTVSTTFNQVADVLIDVVGWVTKSSDRFNGLGKVMSGIMTLVLTPFKLSFYQIKLAVQGAMLAWEKSPFGSGDTKKIAELIVGINDTKGAIVETLEATVDAGKNIITNFGDAIGEIGAIGKLAVKGISDISIKANIEQAKATTAAQNSSKLAEAQIQGLIEKNDLLAETQRQIRDDETKTFAERIAANKKIGEILDDQKKEMMLLANTRVASAKLELDANKDNIDLQVAYQQTLNDRAGVEAQIAGFRSEQMTNEVSLNKELLESKKELLLAGLEGIELELAELETAYEMKLEMARKSGIKTTAITEKYEKDKADVVKSYQDQVVKWSEMSSEQQLGIASSAAGNMAKILGEETAAGKAMAVVQATIDTYASAQAAYKSLAGIPVVGPVLGGIAAAAAVAMGMKNIAAIKGAGGGGGGGGSVSAGGAPQTPAPQMMSGQFELGGGVAPEAVKAYVVSDDITNNQNKLAIIRRRATI
jgi:hypothetical protein